MRFGPRAARAGTPIGPGPAAPAAPGPARRPGPRRVSTGRVRPATRNRAAIGCSARNQGKVRRRRLAASQRRVQPRPGRSAGRAAASRPFRAGRSRCSAAPRPAPSCRGTPGWPRPCSRERPPGTAAYATSRDPFVRPASRDAVARRSGLRVGDDDGARLELHALLPPLAQLLAKGHQRLALARRHARGVQPIDDGNLQVRDAAARLKREQPAAVRQRDDVDVRDVAEHLRVDHDQGAALGQLHQFGEGNRLPGRVGWPARATGRSPTPDRCAAFSARSEHRREG